MNPLEIFAKSSMEVTPSLIEYEVGTEVEMVLYDFLKLVSDKYSNVSVISFFDAHIPFFEYIKRVVKEDEIVEEWNLLPVYSKKEMESFDGAAPSVVALLGRNIQNLEGKSLVVILGLDYYTAIFGEEHLVQMYPRVTNLKVYKDDLDTISILNTKILSDKTIQIINNFSFNVIQLGIERRNGSFERYMLLVKTIFVEYNLRKWFYKVERGKLIFYE